MQMDAAQGTSIYLMVWVEGDPGKMLQEGVIEILRAELPAKLTSMDAITFPSSLYLEVYEPYDPVREAAKYLRKCLDVPETLDLAQALRNLENRTLVESVMYNGDNADALKSLLSKLNLAVPSDPEKVLQCIMSGDYVSPIVHDVAHGVRSCAGDMIDPAVNVTKALISEAMALEEKLWNGDHQDEGMKAEFLEGLLREKLQLVKEGLGKCVLEEMYKPKPADLAGEALYMCLADRQMEPPINLWETLQSMKDRVSIVYYMERGPGQLAEMQLIIREIGLSDIPLNLAECVVSHAFERYPPPEAVNMFLAGVGWNAWLDSGKELFKKAVATLILGGEENGVNVNVKSYYTGDMGSASTGLGKRRLMQVQTTPTCYRMLDCIVL